MTWTLRDGRAMRVEVFATLDEALARGGERGPERALTMASPNVELFEIGVDATTGGPGVVRGPLRAGLRVASL